MMATTAAGSGHPTSCMSAAELVAGTFFYAMKFDPERSQLAALGPFRAFERTCRADPLRRLGRSGRVSRIAPDDAAPIRQRTRRPSYAAHSWRRRRHGFAGQGLSVGAGLAIAQRMDKTGRAYYVLLGDGEMAEGQVWEAAEFAGHYKLDNLTVLADVNALGQSDPTMYRPRHGGLPQEIRDAKVLRREVIDGHDVSAVLAALDQAPRPPRANRKRSSRAPSKVTAWISLPISSTGTAKRFQKTNLPKRSRKSA